MIKEMIVVEGKNDTAAIKRAVQAETIETGGSAVGRSVLRRIKQAQETRGVIVFTDPDYAGERIRKIIGRAVPGVKHAFLNRDEASTKEDIGVENASPEAIRRALSKLWTEVRERFEPPIAWPEMVQYGLNGSATSRKKRAKVGGILGIGYANAKQFYRRLGAFGISRERFFEALLEAEGEPDSNG
jgi:ribonuclease M5